MNLFNDKTENTSDILLKQANLTLIVSESNDFIEKVKSHLYRNGIEEICTEKTSLFGNDTLKNQESCTYAVVDSGDEHDITRIIDAVRKKVRLDLKIVIVGSCDSIAFAERLQERGFSYINFESQLEYLSATLTRVNHHNSAESAMRISILGTKGGIGLTCISWKIGSVIADALKLPVLYIQGNTCTPDIDIMTKKKIERDNLIQHIQGYLYAKMDSFDASQSHHSNEYSAYNIIVREECIKSCFSTNTDAIYENSSVIIILISRDASSLKVAKEYLAEMKNQHLANQKDNFRYFIIMNDYRKNASEYFDIKAIEKFLGEKIDLHVVNSSRNYHSLENFCLSLIGLESKKNVRKWWGVLNG